MSLMAIFNVILAGVVFVFLCRLSGPIDVQKL